jgi:hypothetical protein
VITRTELISVPTFAYRQLPDSLTAPIPAPPAPLLNCADGKGWPEVCVIDALATIPAWQATLQLCNGDRAKSALLGTTDGQQ